MEVVLAPDNTAALALLSGIQSRTTNLEPVLTDLGDYLREREKRVFNTANYGRWAPNRLSTVLRKTSDRPNIETGGLLRAMTDASAPGAHHQVTQDSVTVATSRVGGIMAKRGPSGRPERNPAPPLNPAEQDDVARLFLRGVIGW